MNVNRALQICFSYKDLTNRIIFYLGSRDQEQAAQVCKLWNKVFYDYPGFNYQPLYHRANDLMQNFSYILIAHNHQELVDNVSVWKDEETLNQGFSTCKTKGEALNFFNSIIKPLREACGPKTLTKMKQDIISNLGIIHYNILSEQIDQTKPRKDNTTQIPVSDKDSQMIEADNPDRKDNKRKFDQYENEENVFQIQFLRENPHDRSGDVFHTRTSVQFGNNKDFNSTQLDNLLQESTFMKRFQELINEGNTIEALEIITALENFKGGINADTCYLRASLANKICEIYGLGDAIEYLKSAIPTSFDIQSSFLKCFKIHLNDDKKRLPEPEANLLFLQSLTENRMANETYTLCSNATIKVFLKQPKEFDKTLAWGCDPQCFSTIRNDRIGACVNALYVWPTLPLESLKNLKLAISSMTLSEEEKSDFYYNFVVQVIQHKDFSKEHEFFILEVFYKDMDNEDQKVELIKALIESHFNENSVPLIREMILNGLKNNPKYHDLCLIDCMEWYLSEQNFEEAFMTISKMEQPLLRSFMQANSIAILLKKGCIDQAINMVDQQNIFIIANLADHVINLCNQEKYGEASQFIERIPEQYRRYAKAAASQNNLPLTEEDFHDLQILNTIEQTPIVQEIKIRTALESIVQQTYRDAAQFIIMLKLLEIKEIEKAMEYASQNYDNLLIERAVIINLQSLCSSQEYDEANDIMNRLSPELNNEKVRFLLNYMLSLDD